MNEKEKGLEALTTLPLSVVILSRGAAMDKLTQRTKAALCRNIDALKRNISKNGDDSSFLDSYGADIEGGYSLTPQEYSWIMDSNSILSFSRMCTIFVDRIFPKFFTDEEHPREPGVTCMGYLLDLIDIIDPQVASYDEGVQIVIDTIERSQWCNFFVLGAMIDDSRKLVSKSGIPDVFMDPEAVEKFMTSLYPKLNEDQKLELDAGINMSIHHIHQMLYGTTLN